MILRVRPVILRMIKVASSEIGIAIATIRVARRRRRNHHKMPTASIIPRIMLPATRLIARLIKTDASKDCTSTRPLPLAWLALSSATTIFTLFRVCKALAPDSLSIRTERAGLPFCVLVRICSPRVTFMSAISPSLIGLPSRHSSTNAFSSVGS